MIKFSIIFCICILLHIVEATAQKMDLSTKSYQALTYDFVNDIMKNVGNHESNSIVYLEEKVRGNKCYDTKPDLIFFDRLRIMDIKLLDSLLNQEDINFMKSQAEKLQFKRWEQKKLSLAHVKVLPSASARKDDAYSKGGNYLAASLPFFSKDRTKVIFFLCRQGLEDGWDAVSLYQRTTTGWKLVTTKLTLWHTK